MIQNIPLRLKRLRRTPEVRALLQETYLQRSQFIAPLFIKENLAQKTPIISMPGQFQLGLNDLAIEVEQLTTLGIQSVLLFGIPAQKDHYGNSALISEGILPKAIRKIRSINPNILIISDLCFCEYTEHGHCGILKDNIIDNDATLVALGKQAVILADAGADFVAPSGMTDGMVAAIRQALDKAGHYEVAILSYAIKYSSSFYGPFREALQSAPQFGDRKTYQMNPANRREALREAALDIKEGADVLMVKPAMHYLDVIYHVKQNFPEIPLCAYQVSGEYSMIKMAAANKLIDEQQAILESLISIKRAGSDFIITYFAKDIATLIT